MYSLFILEAAFILPRRRDTWGLALLCMLLLGAMEGFELLGIMPHVTIPYASAEQYRDPVYVSVRYLWQVAVLAGTAAVATQLVGEQREEAAGRQSLAVLDETTGLYARAYFLRALGAEIRRARRDTRPLHILLIDIDCFGDFNRRFGIDVGDRLLVLIAAAITRCVAVAGDMLVTTNLAARFGGEEFVILLAEDQETQGSPDDSDALRLAECLRIEIGEQKVEGVGVTVSVGVASMPTDGTSSDELLNAADGALAAAIEAGGDRVVVASSLSPSSWEAELLGVSEE